MVVSHSWAVSKGGAVAKTAVAVFVFVLRNLRCNGDGNVGRARTHEGAAVEERNRNFG